MIYLLDTDTFIFVLRGLKKTAKPAVRSRATRIVSNCNAHQQSGDVVGVSAITTSELEFGARGSADYAAETAAIQKTLAPFKIFDYDAGCSIHFGRVRFDLRTAGAPIGIMDVLIAAHALSMDATVVTNNVDDFQRVPGLRVVNWS